MRSIYLLLALPILSTSALRTLHHNLTLPHHNFNITEPPSIFCYPEEIEHGHAVSSDLCLPVTRKIMTMRRAERPTTWYTYDMPRRIRERGTPCVVTLNAYDPRGGWDVFSLRVVGLKAVEILELCGKGEGNVGWGGRATVGKEELFWVSVDNGLGHGLAES